MIRLFFLYSCLLLCLGTEPGDGGCCYKRIVTDTQDGLDGEFTLLRTAAEAEHPACADGCVYNR